MSLNRCCSYVGRISGYIQNIDVGFGCDFSATVHEIGHALGFWHEQSRPDRDKYVTIHTHNVHPGEEDNFEKKNKSDVNSLGVAYDFGSIMHYDEDAFGINGTKTISSKENDIPFGDVPELSPLDIKQTNLLYKDQCS